MNFDLLSRSPVICLQFSKMYTFCWWRLKHIQRIYGKQQQQKTKWKKSLIRDNQPKMKKNIDASKLINRKNFTF